MPKQLSTINRVNTTLGLLAVFLLVLGTNRIDKQHFETVQNALTSVFEDRVVAQDYIYKMNRIVYDKKLSFTNKANPSEISNANKELETLLSLFETTELTASEHLNFKSLNENFEVSLKQEKAYFETEDSYKKNKLLNEVLVNLDALTTDLDKLALIQVSQSKVMTSNAQKSLDTNQLMSNMEIWFLLIIGIAIQFIIFYRIKKSTKRIKEYQKIEV